jgi:hypothetical protein
VCCARKVCLRNDSNASTVCIHDWHASHLPLTHNPLDVVNVIVFAAAFR